MLPLRLPAARLIPAALAAAIMVAALPSAPVVAVPLAPARVAADEDSDVPAAADLASDDIYDEASVAQVTLTITPGHVEDLRAEPEEYVAAELVVTVGGEEHGPYAIGARLKGNTSYRDFDGKSAWKLKFGHVVKGQTLFGLRGITLNNMVQDPAMLSEALAYRLFREVGVPAPRTGYAYLTVNGSEYGLYANVENVDATMAARWFPSTRHVLEGDTGVDVTPEAFEDIEVDEGSKSDLADLHALVDVAAADAEDWSTSAQAVADLDEMTRMWAVEHFVRHWDGYSVRRGSAFPANYYLHSTADGRFSMVPSGTDQTWGSSPATGFGEVGSGVLFRRCVEDPDCRSAYVAAVDTVADAAAGLDLAERASDTADLIAPWVQRDPRREVSTGEVALAQAARVQMMSSRVAQARSWLAAPTFVLDDSAGGGGGGGGGGSGGATPEPAVTPAPTAPAPDTSDAPPSTATPAEPAAPVALTAARLAALSGRELAALPPEELARAAATAWTGLRAKQARFLTLAQLRVLPRASVRRWRPETVSALSARQLGGLSPAALAGLRPAQLRALSPDLRRLVARLAG